MNVAVEDLHRVIAAAKALGGKVVLGGHSLGGSVVTAYATWDFNGRAGADDLAGLVYIDGGSGPSSLTAQDGTERAAGVRRARRLSLAVVRWDRRALHRLVQRLGLGGRAPRSRTRLHSVRPRASCPKNIVPPVRVTNVGQYGYALNVGTSPPSLVAAQAHLGTGITASGPVHGWNGAGALTPIDRYTTMFSGAGMNDVDGTEWYFPQRLTDDTRAVNNGNANAAQTVLGVALDDGSQAPEGPPHLRLRCGARRCRGARGCAARWRRSRTSRRATSRS